MSVNDWWWRWCMFSSEGSACGVGFALDRPGTLQPRWSWRFSSSATVNSTAAGSSVQLPGCTHPNRCNVAALTVTVNIFQDDLFIQLFFALHDACLVSKSMLTGDGRTRAGRPFFPFNSAGITLIRNWKGEFVGCLHEILNFHKKKIRLQLLCAVLKYSNTAVNGCCCFEP